MAVRLFADPPNLIVVDPTAHPTEYAAFEQRILAAAIRYTYIDYNTYDEFVDAFDALKILDPESIVSVQSGFENPWLASIVNVAQGATPAAALLDGTYPQLQAEFTRQSRGTITGATTMVELQACCEQMKNDAADYALLNGCVNYSNFGGPGLAFQNGTGGVPKDGLKLTRSLRTSWLSSGFFPTLATEIDSVSVPTGSFEVFLRTNASATSVAFAAYCFVPNGFAWNEAIVEWDSNNVLRKDTSNATVTPDFVAGDLQEAERSTFAAFPYQIHRGIETVADADSAFDVYRTKPLAIISIFSPASYDVALAYYIEKNHWCGLFDLDSDRRAESVVGSFFRAADADTPGVRSPDEFWVWEAGRFYWSTILTNSRAGTGDSTTQIQMDYLRHGIEKVICNRPQLGVGDPTGDEPGGGTDWSAHRAYVLANNLGDLWYRGNPTTVWRNASGVYHATIVAQGLTLNFDILGPYMTAGQIAGTETITTADVIFAWEMVVSEFLVSCVEYSAALIASHEDAGTGPVIPAYTTVVGREPTPDMLVTLASGEVRPLQIGEEVNNIAAGTTPEKWVLCADGVLRQFAGGTGGDITTDGAWVNAGDLIVGTGTDTASILTRGSNGQVLTVDTTETPWALKWATVAGGGDVATDAIWDAKGDLAVGTGANTAIKLSVGTNNYVLMADSSTATGLKWAAMTGGGDALVANPLSQFAATTSAQLRGVISDETGTGLAVFNDTPTLINPALGTPLSGTLTNCSGYVVGNLFGLAANVGTFLVTPSSANLRAAVTDETGSGALVFGTSPTLITPLLGTPTSGVLTNCTSLPLTTGVTGILPVANGGTNNAFFTVAGPATSAKTYTFPNATCTILTSNAAVTVAQGGTGRATSTTAYGLIAAGTTATGAHQTCANGTLLDLLQSNGVGALPTFVACTGTGSPVRATSPTLVTPALGTPTALVLTSATGLPLTTGVTGILPHGNLGTGGGGATKFLREDSTYQTISGGGDALVANPLSQFAATTSAQLAGVISDETGSGALVFAISPSLTTPVLGTPASGTLTNCTGYVVGNLFGLAANVGTFLTTPSSANLAAVMTDETGSGALVFATSPTLVTPVLGTPASGTLTNCTGLPVAGGGTGAATFTDGGVLVGNGTGAVQVTAAGTAGYPLVGNGAGADPTFSSNAGIRSIAIIIGDGTNAITTAMKAMVCVPYGCTIIGHDLVSLDSTAAAVTGSIVLDVWKDTYANWPPTNADTITASAKPTLSSASKATDSTLTGWTTGITAGDYLVVEVESVTTCKQVILTLKVRTTA